MDSYETYSADMRRMTNDMTSAVAKLMPDYDKLVLEVWTDGRITPDDALKQSASILKHHLDVFDREGLLKSYATHAQVDPDLIPEIDFALFDGKGTEAVAEVLRVGKREVTLRPFSAEAACG